MKIILLGYRSQLKRSNACSCKRKRNKLLGGGDGGPGAAAKGRI